MEVSVADSHAGVLCSANQEYQHGKIISWAGALERKYINSASIQSHPTATFEHLSLDAGYVLAPYDIGSLTHFLASGH